MRGMTGGAVLASFIAANAGAAAVAQERRELGAHEHGVSELQIAIEGARMTLRLAAPGVDIVGFEYEARTDEERQAITNARETLSDPAALFTPTAAAGCAVDSVDVDFLTDHGREEHGHGEHGEEEHAEHGEEEHAHGEHGEEEHAEHGEEEHAHGEHGEEEHAAEGASHTEFVVTASFTCSTPEALAGLDAAGFFRAFSTAVEVAAVAIGDGTTTASLDIERTRIDF